MPTDNAESSLAQPAGPDARAASGHADATTGRELRRPTRLAAATEYLGRGWQPVPIALREKGPRRKGWPNFRSSPESAAGDFSGDGNVGLLLGVPSGGLVDVDLDAAEAVAIAPAVLPATAMVHGRPSKPRSHFWFVVETPPAPIKFTDSDGTTLCELRSTGQQTIVPPSIHPSGELVRWDSHGEPAPISAKDLTKHVGKVAAAALLSRHWPAPGARHDAALALSGALVRDGWNAGEVQDFVVAVATAAGDEEARSRGRAATDSHDTVAAGDPATGWPTLAGHIGNEVADRARLWLTGSRSAIPGAAGTPTPGGQPPSRAQRLIELASDVELFHTPDGDPCATAEVNGHRETWPLRSRSAALWLARLHFTTFGRPASSEAIKDTLSILSAKALFDGPEHSVFVRIAEHDGTIYLDLCDAEWRVVEIDAVGFRLSPNPAVRFRRTRGMLPLPLPAPGGDFCLLRRFVNVADEAGWRLLIGWLLGAFHPKGPFPVLNLVGEQGSAKSTAARVLRSLVDPNTAPLRAESPNARDLMVTATNSWCLAFDNLSGLRDWMSDAICRLSTGGGFSARQLFTDSEESILDAQRPVMVTGIEELATRGDLLDRSIIVALPAIADESRQVESRFWEDFHRVRPSILGGLLGLVSSAMRYQDSIVLGALPRMADFARWVAAAEVVAGWPQESFLADYRANRESAHDLALEASPIGSAVTALANSGPWEGSASELLAALVGQVTGEQREAQNWPKTPRQLSGLVRRLAPNLRAVGISVDFARVPGGKRRRIIAIRPGPRDFVPTVPQRPALEGPRDERDDRDGA